ncbi:MAG: DUF2384 domain-containing protein [Alphaproteobacteria bacterium]|nr:DUF2384 domain-containing protein [Alphaproteobacteria bacterium]
MAEAAVSFGDDPHATLPTVIARLGGLAVLGRAVRSEQDLAAAVSRGFPVAALSHAEDAGLTQDDLDLVVPGRTRRHRRARHLPLTASESDGLLRLLRLKTLAEDAFGAADKADRWLHAPLGLLGGAAPMSLARTEAGGRIVEDLIAGIRWGAAV